MMVSLPDLKGEAFEQYDCRGKISYTLWVLWHQDCL